MKKIFTLMVIIALFAILSTTVFAVNFSDLTNEHWAYEPIIEMANKGILVGYPDGSFLPDKSITRAEFAKILVLALELDTRGTDIEFDDVSKQHWAHDYIQTASKYLSAYRNSKNVLMYLPDEKAVREDVAVAMVIASGLENANYDLKTLDKFSDKEQISENFRKYVAIAVENGLMSGHANGTFEPKGYLTRAQVSQLIRNAEDVKEKVVVAESSDNPINISFDRQTLKIDLGENWEKYQYTAEGYNNIYIPTQRYLTYEFNTAYGKDNETNKVTSNSYQMFNGKENMVFKVMLKDNEKIYATKVIQNPFYAEKKAENIYVEASTGKKSVEEIVVALNEIATAEYIVDNDVTSTAIRGIVNKNIVQVIVDVEKYNDGKQHTIRIGITDQYGNKWKEYANFSYTNEADDIVLDDIKFDEKTLKIDLGENWDKYYFCSFPRNGSSEYEKGLKNGTVYIPAQRYLTYQSSDNNYITGRTTYDYDTDKITNMFTAILKDDLSKTKTISFTAPFILKVNGQLGNIFSELEKGSELEINVTGANEIKNIKANWDNHTNTYTINGSVLKITVPFSGQDCLNIVVKDNNNNEYKTQLRIGNSESKENDEIEYFSDIKFDSKKLKIDLGENWSKYVYTFSDDTNKLFNNLKNMGVMYYPSQRTLSYYYGEDDKGEQLQDTGNTRFSNKYVMVALRGDINKNKIIDCTENIFDNIKYDSAKDIIKLDSKNNYLISRGKVYGSSYSLDGLQYEVASDTLQRGKNGTTISNKTFYGDYVVFALRSNPLATKLIHVKKINN